MSNTVRVLCTECGVALRITTDKLPTGHQADELFEEYCPGCERSVYMKVPTAQAKDEQGSTIPDDK